MSSIGEPKSHGTGFLASIAGTVDIWIELRLPMATFVSPPCRDGLEKEERPVLKGVVSCGVHWLDGRLAVLRGAGIMT